MTQHSGLTLAYLGDAYYELQIRTYLMSKGYTKVNDLHKLAIMYTSALGQSKSVQYLVNSFLTEDEISVYKRGRNATSTHKPKNADLDTYRQATGFEALIGFLLLENQFERLEQIILKSIAIIEELPQ
ncbi:MAG: ribonuclease III domain-containing protein [Acholeplasmataceae bacterium]|jgi:ribonuclease-3 family protein|nr:ribonuclease III domain-containing protein [Candidatus Izemoplasmatales bacterium]